MSKSVNECIAVKKTIRAVHFASSATDCVCVRVLMCVCTVKGCTARGERERGSRKDCVTGRKSERGNN